MSRAVRKPLRIRPRSRRTLDERAIIRFPGLYARAARAVFRLSPRSRIRQLFLRRAAEVTIAATNRRDFEAVLPRYHPEVEIVPAREIAGLGVDDSYHGREGFVRMWDDWDDAWSAHAQYEAAELIDLGDTLVGHLRMRSVGEASGAPVEMDATFVWTLSEGLLIKEEHHAGAALDSVLDGLG